MMYGGIEWAERYMANVDGPKPTLNSICYEVMHNPKCITHREKIRSLEDISIDEWLKERANP